MDSSSEPEIYIMTSEEHAILMLEVIDKNVKWKQLLLFIDQWNTHMK